MCVITASALIATASAVSAIAGTALGVATSVQNSASQSAINEYQAKIAEQNAKKSDILAKRTEQEGLEKARQIRMNSLKNIASQKVKFAKGNLLTNSSTSQNIFDNTMQSGELDALTELYNSNKTSENYLNQSSAYLNSAELYNYKSDVSSSLGFSSALSKSTKLFEPSAFEKYKNAYNSAFNL